MKYLFLGLTICLLAIQIPAQAQKRSLSHKDYDGWKSLKHQQIFKDGNYICYEVNPQKGDGFLFLYQVASQHLDSIPRAYDAVFSPDSRSLVFKIKAQFDSIRSAKVKKLKKKDLPKDSLGIWKLQTKDIQKYPKLKSFEVPEEKGEWMAFLLESEKEKTDSLKIDSIENKKDKKKSKKSKKDFETGKLLIRNLQSGKEYSYSNVSEFALSRDGAAINFIQLEGDSIVQSKFLRFDGKTERVEKLFEKKGTAKKASVSADGEEYAFIFSADTSKVKCYELYYGNISSKTKKIADTLSANLRKKWTVSENGKIFFSRNGTKLYFGVAPKPEKEKKDSLLDEEKYHLDVWNWKDALLQPQQKVRLKEEQKRTWMAVYLPKNDQLIQLADSTLPDLKLYDNGNSLYALGKSELPYQQLQSWDDWYTDYYLVNSENGERKLILKKKNSDVSISPDQNYVVWYETKDSTWYSYQIKSGKRIALTRKIRANFYSERHDTPSDPEPYGLVGWTKGDKQIILKDRYDFWLLDPSGEKGAVNLTNLYGRKNKIRFDYVKLDKEERFIDLKKPMILSAFQEENKKSGYFVLIKDEDPKALVFEDASLQKLSKAKNSDQIIFNRSTFVKYPNLWTCKDDFSNQKQVSNANPQQSKFWWGTVDLVDWVSGDGQKLQGLLYKPENFDPKKKYPMLVYFYERTSDRMHRYHVPQPNWSIINPSYCVSNDYVVFMPDITYPKVGYPGESAYSAVVTGTLAMIDRYAFIDKENVALQGQSWGGYQIAYLVTRTDLFKCAMAGAPVSNMTSAYGGIRWGSGMSRMFQYERTQSRIGGTLWNSTLQYIENSPVFFAPKIKTPLLIMHNDNDGAVPWYQGIELFVAMRRLHKPCWMLSYNDEAHNLRKRPNRMDLSIRTMQFFDHYLKGEPAPMWMEKGIPAIQKGKIDAYELVK